MMSNWQLAMSRILAISNERFMAHSAWQIFCTWLIAHGKSGMEFVYV